MTRKPRPAQARPETTRPVNELHDRALSAVPGLARIQQARAVVAERESAVETEAVEAREYQHATIAARVGPGLLTDTPQLPDDLAEQAQVLEAIGPRHAAERQLLRTIRQWLGGQADELMADGIDAAFDVLRAELDDIMVTARRSVEILGDVRTAEDAVEAGNDTADALRTVRELSARYRHLRSTQRDLTRASLSMSEETRPYSPGDKRIDRIPTWGGEDTANGARRATTAVDLFGRYATTQPVVETDDPVELIVRLVDPARPTPEVASLDVVRERTENDAARTRQRHADRQRQRADGAVQPQTTTRLLP